MVTYFPLRCFYYLPDLIPDIKEHYELEEYLGISMFVGKKDYLFASKLAALTDRRLLAIRDIYDVWFFAHNNWDIDEKAKAWVKNHLRKETVFLLKNYQSVLHSQGSYRSSVAHLILAGVKITRRVILVGG